MTTTAHLGLSARAALDEILSARPLAPNAEVRAAFRLRVGRGLSDPSIRAARLRLGLGRPHGGDHRALRSPRLGGFLGLPRDQAEALSWIVAHRPDLPPIDCVALLAAEISHQSTSIKAIAS